MDIKKFNDLLDYIRDNEDTLYYSVVELNRLECLTRGKEIVRNKIYNYIKKGYIVVDDDLRGSSKYFIDRLEVVKYLKRSNRIEEDRFDSLFVDYIS